jgi:hypothetical protein
MTYRPAAHGGLLATTSKHHRSAAQCGPIFDWSGRTKLAKEKDRVATQFELFAGILFNGIGGRTGSGSRYLTYRATRRFLVLLGKNSPAVTQVRPADQFRILAAHAAS